MKRFKQCGLKLLVSQSSLPTKLSLVGRLLLYHLTQTNRSKLTKMPITMGYRYILYQFQILKTSRVLFSSACFTATKLAVTIWKYHRVATGPVVPAFYRSFRSSEMACKESQIRIKTLPSPNQRWNRLTAELPILNSSNLDSVINF